MFAAKNSVNIRKSDYALAKLLHVSGFPPLPLSFFCLLKEKLMAQKKKTIILGSLI